ncbi:MAG: hypothetical protein Ct9H300mP32_0010 [Verrucomicrobiota bacterium]|nr:MAG: hypothetical protein Ct9H300mP32_0010 [Verrucomicrobiota bacterium]
MQARSQWRTWNDDYLDVFVPGRVSPASTPIGIVLAVERWPGRVETRRQAICTIPNIGLVTAAVFVNLDDDLLPELALAPSGGRSVFSRTTVANSPMRQRRGGSISGRVFGRRSPLETLTTTADSTCLPATGD